MCRPSPISDDWITKPTGETTESEFCCFLDATAIQVHSKSRGEEEECLTLNTGASAVFVQGKLHSIHFKRIENKNARKQTSVSLPKETVQMLKQRAQAERISVPVLIERLIQAGN